MGAAREGLIGKSIVRKEDYRFLTGQGQYTDDVTLPHQSYAAFARSPHAHARLKRVDTARAARAPGVLAISSVPPCSSARRFDKGSPSPTPPCLRDSEVSTCPNGFSTSAM